MPLVKPQCKNDIDEKNIDTLLTQGITQLELSEYDSAKDTFTAITQRYPDQYKGWLGLSIALKMLDLPFEKSLSNARALAPTDLKAVLENLDLRDEEYARLLSSQLSQIQMNYEVAVKQYEAKRQSIQADRRKHISSIVFFSVIAFLSAIAVFAAFLLRQRTLGIVLVLILFFCLACLTVRSATFNYAVQTVDNERNLRWQEEKYQENIARLEESLNRNNAKKDLKYYTDLLKE